MVPGKFKQVVFILLMFLMNSAVTYAQSGKEEQHVLVALRMIGHQVLLNANDSTSRIFPIEKEGESYKIHFASAFAFNPGDLASTVNHVVSDTKIASSYIVEVKRCENDEVVYSYEKGDSVNPDLMPCGPRFQPKACYMIFFTILEKVNLNAGSLYSASPVKPALLENKASFSLVDPGSKTVTKNKKHRSEPPTNKSGYTLIALPIGSVFAFIGLLVYFRKKRSTIARSVPSADPDLVLIGDMRFDQRNMVLISGEETIELSSKESDLLSLLYDNVNKTIEREYILKVVWGDEGDYIGRTLDVFVSKLRKKLETEPRVKIVNIRGIGYKFILN